jgi:hypothetical protein
MINFPKLDKQTLARARLVLACLPFLGSIAVARQFTGSFGTWCLVGLPSGLLMLYLLYAWTTSDQIAASAAAKSAR